VLPRPEHLVDAAHVGLDRAGAGDLARLAVGVALPLAHRVVVDGAVDPLGSLDLRGLGLELGPAVARRGAEESGDRDEGKDPKLYHRDAHFLGDCCGVGGAAGAAEAAAGAAGAGTAAAAGAAEGAAVGAALGAAPGAAPGAPCVPYDSPQRSTTLSGSG